MMRLEGQAKPPTGWAELPNEVSLICFFVSDENNIPRFVKYKSLI